MTVDQGEPRPEHIATGKKEHRERELQCRCTHVKLRRPCRGGTQCEQRRCFKHMKRKTHTLHKTRATRHLLLLDLSNWTAKKCLCCSDPRSSDRPRSCACAKADAYLYSVGDAQLDRKNAGEERRPPTARRLPADQSCRCGGSHCGNSGMNDSACCMQDTGSPCSNFS